MDQSRNYTQKSLHKPVYSSVAVCSSSTLEPHRNTPLQTLPFLQYQSNQPSDNWIFSAIIHSHQSWNYVPLTLADQVSPVASVDCNTHSLDRHTKLISVDLDSVQYTQEDMVEICERGQRRFSKVPQHVNLSAVCPYQIAANFIFNLSYYCCKLLHYHCISTVDNC